MKNTAITMFVKHARYLALASIVCISAGVANAEYPERPVHMIVSVSPGGSGDATARIIAEKLSDRIGKPVVVENKPGGGTRIGVDYVLKSKPDGYTLGYFYGGSVGIFQLMFNNYLALEPGKNFEPITLISKVPSFLVVNAALPIKNAAEFGSYAKSNNGKITYGNLGPGSTPNLAAMVLLKSLGVTGIGITYKGNAPTTVALASGEINFSVLDYPSARPMIERGLVRVISVFEPVRSSYLPDVPTMAEAGLTTEADGVTPWTLLAAPAGTPPEVVKYLNKNVREVLDMPDVQERLKLVGVDVKGSTSAQAADAYTVMRKRTSKIVSDLGLTLNSSK